MRKVLLGFAAVLAAAGAAQAGPMESAFGNTVVVTYPNGIVSNLYVNADGTYTASSPQGATSGTWAVADGQTCFTQVEPAPAAGMSPSCAPTVEKNVGDVWDGVGVGGVPVKVTITEGR